MSDHTPGPWVWTPDRETIHGYSHEGEALVVVYELGTNEHDARLIVSAPDLLEALKTVTVALVAAHSLLQSGGKKAAASDTMFELMLDDYQKAIETGRATWIKATGEQS